MKIFKLLLIATFIVTIVGGYLLKRTHDVYTFRNQTLFLCYNKGQLSIYNKLPSYDEMVYSFKPLTLDSYLSDEDITTLKKNK